MSGRKKGLIALISVGFFYGLSGAFAKYFAGISGAIVAFEWRFIAAFLIAAGIVLGRLAWRREGLRFQGINPGLLLLYAAAFPVAVLLFMFSIFKSTVTLATAATFGSALIAGFLFGRLVLKEKLTPRKGLAFLCVISALILFTNPFQDFVLSIGLVAAALSGFTQGFSNLLQRKLGELRADRTSLFFLQCLVGAMLGIGAALISGAELIPMLSPEQWLLMAGFGASSVATVYLFLVGFRYVELNTGSILVSSQLVWGPALAVILLGEQVRLHLVIGAVLVLLAALLAYWPWSPETSD